MLTDYRGQKSVEDINRNEEKGMIFHKPSSHHTLNNYGRKTLPSKLPCLAIGWDRVFCKIFHYRIFYNHPHGPIARFFRSQVLLFLVFKTICGFCITEGWVSWSALGWGNILILLLLVFKIPGNMWLLYYRKIIFLEWSALEIASSRTCVEIHWLFHFCLMAASQCN